MTLGATRCAPTMTASATAKAAMPVRVPVLPDEQGSGAGRADGRADEQDAGKPTPGGTRSRARGHRPGRPLRRRGRSRRGPRSGRPGSSTPSSRPPARRQRQSQSAPPTYSPTSMRIRSSNGGGGWDPVRVRLPRRRESTPPPWKCDPRPRPRWRNVDQGRSCLADKGLKRFLEREGGPGGAGCRSWHTAFFPRDPVCLEAAGAGACAVRPELPCVARSGGCRTGHTVPQRVRPSSSKRASTRARGSAREVARRSGTSPTPWSSRSRSARRPARP